MEFPDMITQQIYEDFVLGIEEQIRMIGDPSIDSTLFILEKVFTNSSALSFDDP